MPKKRTQKVWTVMPGDTLTAGGVSIQVNRRAEIKLMGVDPSTITLVKRNRKLRLDKPLEVGE